MNMQEFLGRHNIPFELLQHYKTFEAQRMAHAVHVSGHQVAKTVMLRLGQPGEYAVVVLPASRKIDLDEARRVLNTDVVEKATEDEIAARCPDCEAGALPPFGSQYSLRTLVDKSLAEEEEIVFEGHSHSEAIRMKYEDFIRVEKPEFVSMTHLSVLDQPV